MPRLKDGTNSAFQYPEEIELSQWKLSEHATNIITIAQRYYYKPLTIYYKTTTNLFEIILNGDYLMYIYIYITKGTFQKETKWGPLLCSTDSFRTDFFWTL